MLYILKGFAGSSDSKESAYKAGDLDWFLGQEDPLEKGMATHSSVLASQSHGQRSLVGYSPWGCKESDMTEWLRILQSGTGGGKLNGIRVASDSVCKGYLIFMGELGGIL